MKKLKKLIYRDIVKEALGKDFVYTSEMIKSIECKYCVNKKCRLDILNNVCVNYIERGK